VLMAASGDPEKRAAWCRQASREALDKMWRYATVAPLSGYDTNWRAAITAERYRRDIEPVLLAFDLGEQP
jgi:hypothetical protein